jgi:hypothetical protein
MAGFAAVTMIISIMDFNSSERLKPELQQLREEVRQQKLETQLIAPCLAKIDSSIRSLRK